MRGLRVFFLIDASFFVSENVTVVYGLNFHLEFIEKKQHTFIFWSNSAHANQYPPYCAKTLFWTFNIDILSHDSYFHMYAAPFFVTFSPNSFHVSRAANDIQHWGKLSNILRKCKEDVLNNRYHIGDIFALWNEMWSILISVLHFSCLTFSSSCSVFPSLLLTMLSPPSGHSALSGAPWSSISSSSPSSSPSTHWSSCLWTG